MLSGARLAGLVAAIIALAFGASLLWEHRPAAPSAEMAVAAKVDTITQILAAKAETVYVEARASAAASRASVRTLRDTLRITDTLEVKAFVARVDTALVKDSVALAKADTAISAEKAVTAAVRTELAIALRPHPAKRLGLVITGLYDPVNHVPLASAALGLRIIGNVSLVGVAFQRVEIGQSPKVFFGMSVRM